MLLSTTREKPRRVGERGGIDRVRISRDRAGAERQRVRFGHHLREARVVAAERGGVRQPVVRDQHRLRAAQVRVGGHQRLARARGLLDERGHEPHELGLQHGNAAPQIEPQIDGDLLVARPPGVQALAHLADLIDQDALDPRVHVLVVTLDNRGILADARQQIAQSARNARVFVRRQHARGMNRRGPRQAARDVILDEALVERKRTSEGEHVLVRFTRESTRPEICHCDAILTDAIRPVYKDVMMIVNADDERQRASASRCDFAGGRTVTPTTLQVPRVSCRRTVPATAACVRSTNA